MRISKRLTCLILAACMLTGCMHGKNNDKKDVKNNEYLTNLPSKLKKEEPVICINRLNLEIKQGLSMSSGVTFHILTVDELQDGDVTVSMDTEKGYQLYKGNSVMINEKFYQNVCMLYNEIDWKYLKEIEQSENDEDIEEFQKIQSKISEEYDELEGSDFPMFYDNEYTIQFDLNNNNPYAKTVDKMDINIKGKNYQVDIGSIIFDEYIESAEHINEEFYFTVVGRMGLNIEQNKEGIIKIPACEMEAAKNVTIKNIKLLNNDEKINFENIIYEAEEDGVIINRQWKDGQEYKVNEGDKLTFYFEVKDENFCNKQNYAVNIYIGVEYEYEGNVYCVTTQALCESRYDSQTLYAMYKDKIDTSDYYNYYVEE